MRRRRAMEHCSGRNRSSASSMLPPDRVFFVATGPEVTESEPLQTGHLPFKLNPGLRSFLASPGLVC